MGWIPLRERIDELPLVIAGPILRRTEPDSVTVWVALKASRHVTLTIFDKNHNFLFESTRTTARIGINLHVVAVTANASSNILKSGENYLYDLHFGNGELLSSPGILTAAGSLQDISYPQYTLPSFALPPSDLKDLRIIHGSCRKPHGESLDALASLDKIIKEALEKDSKKRPHQLFLTGDQIYADDVADVLLFMLIDASETLLGWSEKLPDVENLEELNPGKRNNLATKTAGLTASIGKLNNLTDIAESHLFTFGEYLAMHLFAWSDVLWVEPELFPDFTDINSEHWEAKSDKRKAYSCEVEYIKEFWSTLKNVRRALANIPTYMIFDDHEVTDDWYLNMAWCSRILDKPLGKRILQNGMLASAICQAWGNTPEQFEKGTNGEELLKAAVAWSVGGGENKLFEEQIALRIGLPSVEDIQQNSQKLPHSDAALTWHYIVNGPSYEVIVLDTRTWREFPGKDFDFPALISKEGYDEQISKQVRGDDIKISFVISPSPFIGVPYIENLQKIAKGIYEKIGNAAWGFDTEAWALNKTAFERMIARLALRALPNSKSRVVFLSGDVHYSFGARLQYSAIHPFESPEFVNSELLIAQLTSSSLKNEVGGIGGSHSAHRQGFIPIRVNSDLPTAEVLGWENQQEQEVTIGHMSLLVEELFQSTPLKIKGTPGIIDLVKQRNSFRKLEINKKPEWCYRIDFIASTDEGLEKPETENQEAASVIAPFPGENRKPALEKYLSMAKNYREYLSKKGHGTEIVGLNNLGEINFEIIDGKETIVQTLWWRLESWEDGKMLEPFPLTRCEISLEFDDQQHPMSDVVKEVENS
ncbi:hypothetical protein NIES267_12900 [Calothrix parasitica NIES-267]|uniref:PhoD-like phosphatase metallophosphatase domain-containing protein n=1 Tax=Calothrix parasitica NIES-267 TaxID=1973488 RepID=A0A1Z4LKP2_9CYAN|nr:hypothetical protein NIES267_12900 [Calothrix parasitica NIES-267]